MFVISPVALMDRWQNGLNNHKKKKRKGRESKVTSCNMWIDHIHIEDHIGTDWLTGLYQF